MKKSRIFLSYRRDDSPGYVSRLEDELERVFGDGRVFRDATDIPGGSKWKNVIDANLLSSAVLILVIGPRWEKIWHERINDDVNYVALELQRAHELDVPIFPVTLDGTQLSKGLDLGSINFIYENQFHDISDRQGRWRSDVERLVSLLESVPGMGPARTESAASAQPTATGSKSRIKWLAAVAGLLIVTAVWLGMSAKVDKPGVDPNPCKPADRAVVVQTKTKASTTPKGAPDAVPDISGTWLGKDGTVFIIQQYDDCTFDVESPGFGSGHGQFFANLASKFEVEFSGIGRGEFSVSVSGNKALGWIIVDGQQEFNTLIRVE